MQLDQEQELSTTDVEEAGSSDQQPTQEASQQASTDAKPAQEAKPETPFHEHPRFKEVIEQKNRYADEVKQLKEQFAEMQKRFETQSQPKPQENPLMARLKGIDPEFAEYIENLSTRAQKAEALEQRLNQREQADLRTQAVSEISKLHEANKVPESMREFYEREVRFEAMSNPKLGLQDLPQVYKAIHEKYSKLIEDTKRTERESYVKGKKDDSKAPTSQPKGTTVKPGRPEAKGSPADRHTNIVKDALALMRQEKNA